jgi:pilus assembly protein CpaE
MTKRDVLIVDDSAIVRKMFTTLFTEAGYTVRAAESGEQALAQLQQAPADLIVTDMIMPGMDGYELCRHIRSRHGLQNTPVLAMTSTMELEAKLRGFAAGVDDYIGKDTPGAEVLARAESLLTRRRALMTPVEARGRTVVFFSLKGGVGTSTIAANVALLLAAQRRETVGMLDLALEQASAHVLLDLRPNVDLGSLGRDEVSPGALGPADMPRLTALHPGGVALFAGPRRPEDAECVSPALTQAVVQALAGAYRRVIVDTPASFTEHVLDAVDGADLVVVVVSPDILGTKAACDALRILRELHLGADRLLLVLNHCYGAHGAEHEAIQQALGAKIELVIPWDPRFQEALNRGEPCSLQQSGERRPSPAVAALRDLATRIDERLTRVGITAAA